MVVEEGAAKVKGRAGAKGAQAKPGPVSQTPPPVEDSKLLLLEEKWVEREDNCGIQLNLSRERLPGAADLG